MEYEIKLINLVGKDLDIFNNFCFIQILGLGCSDQCFEIFYYIELRCKLKYI